MIGLEHYEGRHNYELSSVKVNGKYAKEVDKTSVLRAPSPLAEGGSGPAW